MKASGSHAIEWRKSSHSGHSGGECVEVAGLGDGIGVRDSKNPEGPKLTLDATSWRAFIRGIKADRPGAA
ncbi:DUF397 domain-containing protein [Actinomadura fibrosa]|uniref:DUF397 domain-containing protein n=1 Tax=Actinomadura fibrosa TaxID=111802 RepID=A0ABW2XVA5_9ACTN|nr:DUF397 domain-containing protein [Actinomadura fibrosa]